MKKKSKFFIILSICTMFSITIIAANIPQNTIKISTENDNSVISLLTPKVSAEGDVTSLWNYTFSNNPRRVAISGDGHYIMVINESTATFFHRNSNLTLWSYAPGAQINNEAMSFNGKYVVLVDNDNNITLLDRTSKTELWNFDDFSGCSSAYVDISDDGNYIAVANRSGGVYLFDNEPSVGQKQPKWFYDDGTWRNYRDITISGNGQYIVACDYLGNITVFNSATTTPKTYAWQYNTTNWAKQVAISYEGNYFITCNNENEVYLFNTTNPQGKPMWNFTTPNIISTIEISSDGNNIVVSERYNTYYFNNSFQSDNKTAEWSYPVTEPPSVMVTDCAITGNGKYVVLGTWPTKTCHLLNDTKTTPKMHIWKNPIVGITSVDISELGNYFVFVSYYTDKVYLYHHDIPIPVTFRPLLGDDDDDDDNNKDSVIPYGNYYLLFTVVAIVALISILKRKKFINNKK